ncbi:Myb-like DNA-binding domain containing protein [Tritrichomonas foetus]|uniref:Myb-like DNA-binding domain containing protein n=1 Tax=Tritrichomonas foetus TaxID=1144522 RepID=A0A1J4L0W1_9EUKA|nr:Myb-like DNA-binding domain containing protein [Tritrichomonas foetus]|eukprot:OHT17067.1 Myb-like DNA-binding domain containing protein [Tritrichomonas foetus]
MMQPNLKSDKDKPKRQKFSTDEDLKLKKAVAQLGTNSWKIIALEIPGRTPRQCRDRWKHYLCPDANLKDWTKEEDSILVTQFNNFGNHWAKIASFFPGRTSVSVRNRCRQLVKQLNRQQEKIASIVCSQNSHVPNTKYDFNIDTKFNKKSKIKNELNIDEDICHGFNQGNFQNNSLNCNLLNTDPNTKDNVNDNPNTNCDSNFIPTQIRNFNSIVNRVVVNLNSFDDQKTIKSPIHQVVSKKIHLPPCCALPFQPTQSHFHSDLISIENILNY